jgi:hypothetical protein
VLWGLVGCSVGWLVEPDLAALFPVFLPDFCAGVPLSLQCMSLSVVVF